MTHLNRRRLIGAGLATMAAATVAYAATPKRPLIVGHRGAPGYLPEHTIPGYELAIKMGADFIEPDVVSTLDGQLIVRHEPLLSVTTDVADRPEFAGRKRTRTLDGIETTDFFTCDFNLAEIKTLRARQAFANRDHSHDGLYQVQTLQEVIDLAQAKSRETGRTIGLYPEIKHPTFHQQLGLAIEDKLLDMLKRAGLDKASSPVIIQSFETANLKYLRRKTTIRLMQLIDGSDTDPDTGAMILQPPSDKPYDWVVAGRAGDNLDQFSAAGLKDIATYADIVAPWKRHLLSFAKGQPVRRKEIVDNAHACGLQVHSWTMRNDQLDPYYNGDAQKEYFDLFDLGVDGLFTDFADTGVKARDAWMNGRTLSV
ncbi:glycerophosphodiester phosphodiesterase [Asticcacaulis sp.]|uniref:glycerophosphodiester phosphodiesterase n=1 Tax=Asticcacaulis sp. TaxID=1872648 RepID=UPI003F7CCE23